MYNFNNNIQFFVSAWLMYHTHRRVGESMGSPEMVTV